MKTKHQLLLTASTAFASGFASGLLYASDSGRKLRSSVARIARAQSQLIEARLRLMEDQLRALERQVQTAGQQVGTRIQDATGQAWERYIPTVPDDPDSWEIKPSEMARELPRLPRS